ncbi:MFS transporter [Paenibacillus macerans]|uniref:MFS transporter n=1 Tax=Paenibacillus macerans TaxID=44252 RepID=UPI0020411FC9|nr:MFS transporter [Paenibacillus macerans]MCM3701600.1 MFS transporter [Paenibacillus macerans]
MVRQPKFMNYLSYGLGDFLGAGAFALTAAWLLFFLTTFCGLTAVEAGSIFAIARIVDAVAAPTMGYITDNFHKTKLGRRFGRRKFFILASIPLVLVYTLIWISGFSYWYYLLTYILFEIVYSMILIPYDTLAAEMSSDYKVRSKFTGARMFVAQASAVFAAFIPGRLVETLGKDDPLTYLYSGIIFTVIFVVVLLLLYRNTWERPFDEIPQEEVIDKRTFFQNVHKIYADLISTLRVKTFRHHLGMYLGGYLSQDVFNAVFTYFVVFALMQSAVAASNLLTFMYVMQLFGVWIALTLTIKLNPAPAYRTAISLFIAGIIGFIVLKFTGTLNSTVLLFVMIGICGLGRGGLNYIPWNNYAFIPDVDEALTGQRREGVFAGVMSLIRKGTQALAVFLVGVALQEAGFVSGQASQPDSAVTMIISILLFGTLIFLAGGLMVSYRYKLTKENHVVLLDEIKRLKNGGSKQEVTTEARKVFEQLTGWEYEKTWGNNTVGYENLVKSKENTIFGGSLHDNTIK